MQPHTNQDSFETVRRMVLDMLEQTERGAQAQAQYIVEQAEAEARDIVSGAHDEARDVLAEAEQTIDEMDTELSSVAAQIEQLRSVLNSFRGRAPRGDPRPAAARAAQQQPVASGPAESPAAEEDAGLTTRGRDRAWNDRWTDEVEPAPLADLEDEGSAFDLAETPPDQRNASPDGSVPADDTGASDESLRALRAALEALNRPRPGGA